MISPDAYIRAHGAPSVTNEAEAPALSAAALPAIVEGTDHFDALTGGKASVPRVNPTSALQISAVYGCVSLLSGAIASLPVGTFRRDENDDIEAAKHDIWWALNEEMAPRWSAYNGWEFTAGAKLLRGDGFIEIKRQGARIVGFEPLHPLRVDPKVIHLTNGSRLAYVIQPERDDKGRAIGRERVIDQDDMLHFAGFGFDGRRSLSPLGVALRYPAGVAMATQRYAGEFFANGARPDFVLSTEQNVTVDKLAELQKLWEERHKGFGNAHKPAWLANGLKIQNLTMTLEDAQLLETRKFSVEEICRIYGVPPFMIGHNEKTTSWGTGIEQMGMGFVRYALRPHLSSIKAEINRKCFRRAGWFAEHVTAALESGDIRSQNESARMSLGRAGEPGWMTVNEVRRMRGLRPVPGGDVLYDPRKGKGDASQSKPAPAREPEQPPEPPQPSRR